MSFRLRRRGFELAPPCKVNTLQEKSSCREDGLQIVDVVSVDARSIDCVPSPSEYSLEKLQAAGVPLNTVNTTVLDSVPTEKQAENIINSLGD